MEHLTLPKPVNGSRIILSLSGVSRREARTVSGAFGYLVAGIKVTDLIDRYGTGVIERYPGIRLADVKIYDSPATTQARINAYAGTANLVTVHLSAGEAALRAAVAEARQHNMGIVGIAVPSGQSEAECRSLHNNMTIPARVSQLSQLAYMTGVYGIICPTHQNALVRQAFPNATIFNEVSRSFLGFTHQQAQHVSPTEAIANGADYIICGPEIMHGQTMIGTHTVIMQINTDVAAALRHRHHE